MIEYSAWGVDYDRFVAAGYKLCWVKYHPETFGAAFQFIKPVNMLVGYTDTFNLTVPKSRARTPLYKVLPREYETFRWPDIEGQVTRWGLPAYFSGKTLIHPCGHRLLTDDEVTLILNTDKSAEWLMNVIEGDDNGWAIAPSGEVYSMDVKVIDVTNLKRRHDWDHELPEWCLT